MTPTDAIYLNLINQIHWEGDLVETRNHLTRSSINTDSCLFTSTPLITLRKVAWKKAIREMEWFMSGDIQCPTELLDWWNGQLADSNRYYLGYSHQFRHFDNHYDQIRFIQEGLRNNPYSRRLILTTWNPADMASITDVNANPNTPTCCLPGTVKVISKTEGLISLDTLSIGDEIWDGESFIKVKNKWSTGIKEVFEYKTRQGILQSTQDHKVVTENDKIRQISQCERINVIKGPKFERTQINWIFVKNGLLLGDGTCQRDKKGKPYLWYLHIGENDMDYLSTPISTMVEHKPSEKYDNTRYQTKYDYGDLPKTYERIIPPSIFHCSPSEQCDFLMGLFSANGSVGKTSGSITLCQTSEKLVQDVQLILNSLGIRSSIHRKEGQLTAFKGEKSYQSKDTFILTILSKDIATFIENIGFIQKYKMERTRIEETVMNRDNVSIDSKVSIGFQETFDIEVESENHTFWCNGLNVSNCHNTLTQFFVRYGTLHLVTVQRSADVLLGVPHNWIQTWAMLMYLARHANLKVGWMKWSFGDAHIYQEESHLKTVEELLACKEESEPNSFELIYNPTSKEFIASDFSIEGTIPNPKVLTRPRLL